MEPIIRNELHILKLDTVSVKVESYIPPRVSNPTERELATVPARFRCILCSKQRGKKHFGGFVCGERVCRLCYPTATDRDVSTATYQRKPRLATRRNRRIPSLVQAVWQGKEMKEAFETESFDELIIRVVEKG